MSRIGPTLDVRSESGGSKIYSVTLPTGPVAYPVIVTDNLLFAISWTATYVVALASRRILGSYPAGGALALSKAGLLFIAQADGTFTAIAVR